MHTSIYNGNNFYVYLITDLNPIGTERYYIGSSTRKELQENNIDPENHRYFGSSYVKYFRSLQDVCSSQLERVVVKTFNNSKECLEYEEFLQRDHEVASNPLFYNLSYANCNMTNTPESTAKQCETINDPKWKATVGKEGMVKRSKTINDPKWKATVGKEGMIKRSKTINDPEWMATVGKEGMIKRSKTISDPEWKATIGKEGIAKQLKIFSDPEWKATIGKEGIAKQVATVSDETWKATIGKEGIAKQVATVSDETWKATIGKEQTRKRLETNYGHKCYGFKGVGEYHTIVDLHHAIKSVYGCCTSLRIIRRYFKNLDATICNKSFIRSPFLQSLGENFTRKTWRDVGFYYYTT